MVSYIWYIMIFIYDSENQKNREAYWATRCEDLKKQNCDLKDYIALFPKVLEVSVTNVYCAM